MSEGLIRQTLEELKPLITSEEQQEALNYLAVNISGDVAGNLTVAQRIINHIDLPEDMRARFNDLLRTLEEQARFVPSGKRLFLSYAWADDQPFVERLYDDLKAQGYVVWWDQTNLASRGLPILQELRDAIIDESDRIIPIVGPAALESVNVQYEWDTARQHCKLITPLLRLGDHDDLPPDFQDILYFDFRDDAQYEKKLAELLIALERPVRPPARLINVPSLPDHFLYRTDDMQAVEDLLLADIKQPVVVSGKQQQVNVQGMGGIGKSVIAAALAHDCAIRRAFPDGIFWVQIGQSPDPVSLIGSLCQSLSGINQDFKGNLEVAKTRLSELLADRAYLLILDDVWEREHARAFDVLGERSRILLTTRIVDLVDDAPQYRLGVLSGDQAYALLSDWAGYADQGFHAINDHLSGLPLALRLAGAQLKRGMAIDDWLARYDRVSRIKVSRNARGRDESLQACFDLSVEAFAADGDDPLLYHLLGIFPEDVWVPEQVVLRLWKQIQPDLDDYDGIEIIEELERLNLVERNRTNHTIRLHDLLHDYNAEQLGEGLTDWHAALLDSYNSDQFPWHEIPDDGYIYDHLVYHLHQAGWDDQIHQLFDNDEWMLQRFRQSGYTYSGFINDVMFAWEELAHPAAQHQIDAEESPKALSDCIHFALIRTSVNSLSRNYIPALVARAVSVGMWGSSPAIALATTIPDAESRCEMYSALLSTERLQGESRLLCVKAGLEMALSIEDEYDRAEALSALAGKLEGRLLEKGLEAALSIRDEAARARVLGALAGKLEGEERQIALEKGLEAAFAIEHEWYRAEAFSALADKLEGRLLERGLEAAFAIEDERERARALSALADKLEGRLLERGLEAALSIRDEAARARALGALAGKLEGEERQAVLERGLEAALSSEDEADRAKVLSELAGKLEGEERQAALERGLEAALSIGSEPHRANALSALADRLKGPLLEKGLEAALSIPEKRYRERVLCALVGKLEGPLLERGLEAALSIEDERYRGLPSAPWLTSWREGCWREGWKRPLPSRMSGRGRGFSVRWPTSWKVKSGRPHWRESWKRRSPSSLGVIERERSVRWPTSWRAKSDKQFWKEGWKRP